MRCSAREGCRDGSVDKQADVKPDAPSPRRAGVPAPSSRAVFVDRDGTLNELVYDEVHGILDSARKPDQVVLLRGAGAFLKGVRDAGYRVVVVTNQPGIAKGTLSLSDLEAVHRRLAELLAADGGRWDEILYSPYHPTGGPWARPEYVKDSECRKPKPGMLLRAAREHGIDLGQSWMVGDGLVDVQAGRSAGCRTILLTRVKVSHIEKFMDVEGAEPDYVAGSLPECLEIIKSGRQPPRRKE